MGPVLQVRMKPGCISTKFACQPGRKTGTSVERQYIRKKRKMMAIEECEKQLEESNRVTEHFDFEDIASGSSGVNEATVYVVTTLGASNLEFFLWRAIGKVNCNYCGTAPNVSGMHGR
ncbi:hypothetical protein FQA39_LY06770 [Lamprigera yunnana]|nr:hypothetical protein FQA39_LY06770 [Lamprigera yunnana]